MRLGLLQAPRRTRAEARARLEGIYERFPRTAERRRQMGTTLSGGVQQMPMAGVLAGSPKLLLRNESTEGLTPMFVNGLFELMAGLAREGIPIVLVEQTVRRAIALAHRFYAIERGQVVAQGRSDDAASRADVMRRLGV